MANIRYIKDNEWAKFPNFRKEEFKCPKHCNGYPSGIAYSLIEFMQTLRNHYGRSIHVNSGVRCQAYNDELKGSSAESDHRLGLACDFNFDNHIFSEAEKNEIMAYMRTLPNIKYCYTNQSNMFNGIHVSVNPTYEKANITKFEAEEIGQDYVKIAFETDLVVDFAMYSLNGLEYVNLDAVTNSIGNLKENTKYTLSIKVRTAGTNDWTISDTIEFTTLENKQETAENSTKEEDKANTPVEDETSEKEQKEDETIDINVNDKESVILWIVKQLYNLLKKIVKKS